MKTYDGNYSVLVIPEQEDKRAKKDTRYRLERFARWLTEKGKNWYDLDLIAYREHLKNHLEYAPTTINVHLSTIRARYRALLANGTIQAALEARVTNISPEYRADWVQRTMNSIKRAIDPKATHINVEIPPSNYRLLSWEVVKQLIMQPSRVTLVGVRDAAILSLLVTTGIRVQELCALRVSDLYHLSEGKPALHVPPGTGCTERLVPYGSLMWGLKRVNDWLLSAEIAEGPAFRGFYKGGEKPRPYAITPTGVEAILASYPVEIEGELVTVRPMDLRRTYAKFLHEAGVDPTAIQANLGLQNINTVLNYLGVERPGKYVPPPSNMPQL